MPSSQRNLQTDSSCGSAASIKQQRHSNGCCTATTDQQSDPPLEENNSRLSSPLLTPTKKRQQLHTRLPSTAGSADCAGSAAAEDWQNQFYKTKLCPYNVESRCVNGATCRFAHTLEELRPLPNLQRTKLCEVFVKRGVCHNRPTCPFAHHPSELRTSSYSFYKVALCNFYRKGRCWNGAHCRFAHGLLELQSNRRAADAAAAVTVPPLQLFPQFTTPGPAATERGCMSARGTAWADSTSGGVTARGADFMTGMAAATSGFLTARTSIDPFLPPVTPSGGLQQENDFFASAAAAVAPLLSPDPTAWSAVTAAAAAAAAAASAVTASPFLKQKPPPSEEAVTSPMPAANPSLAATERFVNELLMLLTSNIGAKAMAALQQPSTSRSSTGAAKPEDTAATASAVTERESHQQGAARDWQTSLTIVGAPQG